MEDDDVCNPMGSVPRVATQNVLGSAEGASVGSGMSMRNRGSYTTVGGEDEIEDDEKMEFMKDGFASVGKSMAAAGFWVLFLHKRCDAHTENQVECDEEVIQWARQTAEIAIYLNKNPYGSEDFTTIIFGLATIIFICTVPLGGVVVQFFPSVLGWTVKPSSFGHRQR
ncbi:hypothetical protein BJ742DRAFT_765958 [Cladochytrium replicatum]|nr:hypothetical protein BJ742DRAFT_765958 [Cladochytrium replicatum]